MINNNDVWISKVARKKNLKQIFQVLIQSLKIYYYKLQKIIKKTKNHQQKKTSPIRSSKNNKTTKNRKIVKLDLKKIRETIEQSVAMAKKNKNDDR